jgi:Domain of unknown function (DUF3303)
MSGPRLHSRSMRQLKSECSLYSKTGKCLPALSSIVVRIGDYGGYMIVETDKPADIHYVTSVFAVFELRVEPVIDVMDAVSVELDAIEYRKQNAP